MKTNLNGNGEVITKNRTFMCKTGLMILLLIGLIYSDNLIFAQVTERELPQEWNSLVKGARFRDRFLPMEGSELSYDTWGGANVVPRYIDNGIEDRIWSD